MKRPWIILLTTGMLFCLSSWQKAYCRANPLFDLDVEVLKTRFEAMPLPMEAPFDRQFIPFIKEFLVNGRRESEKILKRAALYFPIFEYHLESYNLPQILKYLPIVESRLLPDATSYAGAGGLWQFMPKTAEMYGLQITEYVDQRLSPQRSSEAAVRLLADLYQEFDDWLLALAAYNCGPGRVHRAIRRDNCENYWDISYRLPRQTQSYIHRFLAATYVFNYQRLHGLSPTPFSADFVQTQTIKVYHYLTLEDIAQHCGVAQSTLKRLNPAFLTGVIPNNHEGYLLTLPSRIMPAFRDRFADRIDRESIAHANPDRLELLSVRCFMPKSVAVIAQLDDYRAGGAVLRQESAQTVKLVGQKLTLHSRTGVIF